MTWITVPENGDFSYMLHFGWGHLPLWKDVFGFYAQHTPWFYFCSFCILHSECFLWHHYTTLIDMEKWVFGCENSAQQLIILNVGGNDQKQGNIAKPTLRNANAVTLQQVNVFDALSFCNAHVHNETFTNVRVSCWAENSWLSNDKSFWGLTKNIHFRIIKPL